MEPVTMVSHALQPLIAEEHLDGPYIVAGDRAYVIGRQGGSFPDMGWHLKGEMGGIWAHPIKLLDGFWLRVGDTWLTAAHRFRIGPYWADHEYELDGLRIVRHELVPDAEPALVVRYTFITEEHASIALRFLARTDLREVWVPGETTPEDALDVATYLPEVGAWSCRNGTTNGYVVAGARGVEPVGHAEGRDLWGPERTAGQGISIALDYELQLKADEPVTLEFVIAGSEASGDTALRTYRRVSTELPTLQLAKERRYDDMLSRSALQIPDSSIQRAWNWVKCNYDWLVREVEEWGRGLGAGVADYPWWFGCDNGYALRGCLVLGQHDIAIDTLDLLRRVSAVANQDSGRVIHEANTRGVAKDLGRTEETPQFIRTVWDTFRWTGDIEFLQRNYAFCKRGLLEWTLGEQTPNGEVLPSGYGVMEMLGLNLQCIDTASLTIEALVGLAGMAEVLGDEDTARHCKELAVRARRLMEDAFWMEAEGLYGDMLATPMEMVPRLQHWWEEARAGADTEHAQWMESTGSSLDEMAASAEPAAVGFRTLLDEAEADPEQHRKRPWLLKNWSIISPLEAGLAPQDRAVRTLERMEGPEFTGRWGVYIDGIYQRAMMSISTGVVAVAEALYGRPDQALAYIRMMTDTLDMQMPGAIAEMSPNYGCFVQAWSGYGVAWPVVTGIFGVRPDAYHRRIKLSPHFPSDWSDAHLTNLVVGTNSFDLYWDGTTLSVTSREPGWDIQCDGLPLRLERPGTAAEHDSEP
jgi:glycogen debranching enzyme